MKYILIAILALMISGPLLAHDGNVCPNDEPCTGLFYDMERDKEGINVLRRDNLIEFTFFTYIKRCNHRYFDGEATITDLSFNYCKRQQAWYVTGAHPIHNGEATGVLYTANPHDYYYGHDDEPIDTFLANSVDIGLFVLTRTPTGYDMIVLQTGNVLHPNADIYHRTFHFSTYLFGPEHPIPVE